MTRRDSNRKRQAKLPIWLHKPSGQWCRTHNGRRHYFGRERDEALAKHDAEWEYLTQGKRPPEPGEDGYGCDVALACNAFLTSKEAKLKDGRIEHRTFSDHLEICELIVTHFGRERLVSDLRPSDFRTLRDRLSRGTKRKRLGATSVKRRVSIARSVFKHAYDNDLIEHPVRFGTELSSPSQKELRQARHKRGSAMMEPAELRKLISKAQPHIKAFILLGLNCGMGNADCAELQHSDIDLSHGWLDYPRPKTAVRRRAKLWPETVAAITAATKTQRTAKVKADRDLVFVTRCGNRWAPLNGQPASAITNEFRKLLDLCELYRRGRSFYRLRHIFRTIADEVRDQPAADLVMGHAPAAGDMAAVYRERISDERLEAIADHVRAWLFLESVNSSHCSPFK